MLSQDLKEISSTMSENKTEQLNEMLVRYADSMDRLLREIVQRDEISDSLKDKIRELIGD